MTRGNNMYMSFFQKSDPTHGKTKQKGNRGTEKDEVLKGCQCRSISIYTQWDSERERGIEMECRERDREREEREREREREQWREKRERERETTGQNEGMGTQHGRTHGKPKVSSPRATEPKRRRPTHPGRGPGRGC